MDLRQLQYFLASVENRSFGRAARALNVTQPALSKSIQRLEASLGVQLFDRLPRGVVPTVFGEALAAHANLVEGQLERARASLVAIKEGSAGKVVIGAGSSMRLELLPEATVRLRARHPEVEIKMIGELYDRLMVRLERGECDLVISMIPGETVGADIVHEPLYLDQTHPTVRVGHPLTRRHDLDLESCLDYPWILPGKDNLGRRHLDAFFLARDLPPPEPAIESDSTLYMLAVIRKSDFIGWNPTQVLGRSAETGLAALALDNITLTRTVGVSYRRDAVQSPAALLLIEELKRVGHEMVEAGVVMPLTPRRKRGARS